MTDHTSDLWFCHQLGARGYRPFNIMGVGFGTLEFVSYPWPEKDGIYINARTIVGDPTSMKTFKFERGELVQQ